MEKIKQIFEKNKKIVWVVIAILLTIGINMSIDYDTDKLTFNGNQIVWLLVCVFIYFILKKSDEYHEKKLLIYSSVIGVICAICQPITKLTFDIWSTNEVVFTSGITAYFIFKIITYTIIFVSLFKIIFKEIEKIETKTTDTNKAKDRLKPTFKVFLVVAGILLTRNYIL